MLSFRQKVFFMASIFSNANVQCVHIVYTKYQDVSVKAMEWVELPVYALSMHHQELQRAITLTELAPRP